MGIAESDENKLMPAREDLQYEDLQYLELASDEVEPSAPGPVF